MNEREREKSRMKVRCILLKRSHRRATKKKRKSVLINNKGGKKKLGEDYKFDAHGTQVGKGKKKVDEVSTTTSGYINTQMRE